MVIPKPGPNKKVLSFRDGMFASVVILWNPDDPSQAEHPGLLTLPGVLSNLGINSVVAALQRERFMSA